MRKQLKLIIALVLVAILITGCAGTVTPTPTVKPTVMASVLPSAMVTGEDAATAAKDAVESVAGVTEAWVVVSGTKAVVAVTLTAGTSLTDSTKPSIETAVKGADKSITTVYMTADAAIFTEVKTLAGKVKTMPASELTTSFDAIVAKISGATSMPSIAGNASASPMASAAASATAKATSK